MSAAVYQLKPRESQEIAQGAQDVAGKIDDPDLVDADLEQLLTDLTTQHAPSLVSVNLAERSYVTSMPQVTFRYPISGSINYLSEARPPELVALHSAGGHHWGERKIVVDPADAGAQTAAIGQAVAAIEARIRDQVEDANRRIEAQQVAWMTGLRAALEPRWTLLREVHGAMAALDIPLNGAEHPIAVPVEPAPLSMLAIEAAADSGAPEFQLADKVADAVIKTIVDFSRALERLPQTARAMLEQDEEPLRDVLLFILNAQWQAGATGETFTKNGKTDIVLRWRGRDAFVAECKIAHGPKALTNAVDQLLDNYTLWRHTRLAVISFYKKPRNATTLITDARNALEAHRRAKRALPSPEPESISNYEVEASGDEKRLATLSFVPVVIG